MIDHDTMPLWPFYSESPAASPGVSTVAPRGVKREADDDWDDAFAYRAAMRAPPTFEPWTAAAFDMPQFAPVLPGVLDGWDYAATLPAVPWSVSPELQPWLVSPELQPWQAVPELAPPHVLPQAAREPQFQVRWRDTYPRDSIELAHMVTRYVESRFEEQPSFSGGCVTALDDFAKHLVCTMHLNEIHVRYALDMMAKVYLRENGWAVASRKGLMLASLLVAVKYLDDRNAPGSVEHRRAAWANASGFDVADVLLHEISFLRALNHDCKVDLPDPRLKFAPTIKREKFTGNLGATNVGPDLHAKALREAQRREMTLKKYIEDLVRRDLASK